jgi:hypothetical protein
MQTYNCLCRCLSGSTGGAQKNGSHPAARNHLAYARSSSDAGTTQFWVIFEYSLHCNLFFPAGAPQTRTRAGARAVVLLRERICQVPSRGLF